jgi:rsbT co-antagonist protein RsbR
MSAATGREIKSEGELQHALADILGVLRSVEDGELSARIDVRFDDTEPLAALGKTVNGVIQQLMRVREETQVYQRELEEQLETIEKQRAAIKELSTPMIEVWAGVMCVPIVGMIDSTRAAEMTSALLQAVVEKKVLFAIIDITGIDVMDTRATDHFLRMARSVRLLGAECVLSGINPNVARSIVHMGVELTGIETYRTLRDALQHHVRRRRLAAESDRADDNEASAPANGGEPSGGQR